MRTELIPLFHELGFVTAVWLHARDKKILSILRESPYQKWAFVNEELGGWSVTLGENGTIKNAAGYIKGWSFYDAMDTPTNDGAV